MLGKLSVIGIGPGDPELLTLKAVRVIKESQVLCVPKGRKEGSSLALSIVEKAVALKGKEILEAHFPMMKTRKTVGATPRGCPGQAQGPAPTDADNVLDEKWNAAAVNILAKLREGSDVVFPTLGDPTIYSTFFYLYDKLIELEPDLEIEIVPGVSSINASAARANMYLGLGNDSIAVLPANYMDNLKTTLSTFNTVVLMKVNKVLNEIVKLLTEMELVDKAVCVSRVGMKDEKVITDINGIRQDELNYFSMIIVRR